MTTLYNGDCLEKLDLVQNKSIQSIIIDPPYNINKDFWDNIENYDEWITTVMDKLLEKMKDNGSFFIFHNNMETISKLMVNIKLKFPKLKFQQMIVWNKRFNDSPKKGFLDGFIVKEKLHNWNKMVEYILYYVFDNTYKIKKKRIELKIKSIDVSKEILSKNGNITGWYSNIELGKNLPTKETIKPIKKHLGLEYDDIVPKYNNLKKDHSVWNYDIATRNNIHITPKPIDLLKNIILHTTDEDDIVLDCFAGTGSLGVAAKETNRKCILIEKNVEYFKELEKLFINV
jgi:site-specific DNA-methyltransferase (adenine-specific)